MITLIIILAACTVTIVALARQLRRAYARNDALYARIDALDDQNIELSIQVIGRATQVTELSGFVNELAARNALLIEEMKRRDARVNDLLDIVRMYDTLYGAQVLRRAQQNQKRSEPRWVYLN